MPDPIRRQGASNPAHAGAFAPAGHGVANPAAEKAQAPKLPTATQPQQLGKVAKAPGAGAAPATPAQPQAHLAAPLLPPQPGQLSAHLASGQANIPRLLHSGEFPWHHATGADIHALHQHLSHLPPADFWATAHQAASGLSAAGSAPHVGSARYTLQLAAMQQPRGPTVPLSPENQSRAVQLDFSKLEPFDQPHAEHILHGLPRVEGVENGYFVPAGFDVSQLLGDKLPVRQRPVTEASQAQPGAAGGATSAAQSALSADAQRTLSMLHTLHAKGIASASHEYLAGAANLPVERTQAALSQLQSAGLASSHQPEGSMFEQWRTGGEPAKAPMSAPPPREGLADEILAFMRQRESHRQPLHDLAIADNLGVRPHDVQDALASLERQGAVGREGNRWYDVPAAVPVPGKKGKVALSSRIQKDQPIVEQHAKRLFAGGDLEQAHSVVGLPDDAELVVTDHGRWEPHFGDDAKMDADGIEVTSRDPRFSSFRRFIGIDGEGKKFIKNDILVLKQTGTGLGTQIFTRQVEQAAAAGFDYIQCHAAESPTMNGYYTWPRMGYNESIDRIAEDNRSLARAIRKNFPDAEDILDVMAAPGGKEWWKENGTDLYDARFDLKAGSKSQQQLAAYRAEQAARRKG